jgi:hypothetical protein
MRKIVQELTELVNRAENSLKKDMNIAPMINYSNTIKKPDFSRDPVFLLQI